MLDLDESFSKTSMDIISTLTPSHAPSQSSMSFMTPGRDLEDRWRLGEVFVVGS